VRRYARQAGGAGDVGEAEGPAVKDGWSLKWDISEEGIADSQLRMLFAVCHRLIRWRRRCSLALRALCGFTIDEIAQALLTTKANMNKRLYRAKERLREERVELEMPVGDSFDSRLDAVMSDHLFAFYEGYYSASPDAVCGKTCVLRRAALFFADVEGGAGEKGGSAGGHDAGGVVQEGIVRADVYALLALMCFQASRFEARFDDAGGMVCMSSRTWRWDRELIDRGNYFLVEACERGWCRDHFEAALRGGIRSLWKPGKWRIF